ncbi:MAG: riboflavin synthase [Candidatus Omnitrophica bacterium]|nr:riboflavin synthase [Candidatus Omnitrophota bacterium]
MFSGIVEELGKVISIAKQSRFTLLKVQAEKVLEDTRIGDSIAVNGVCLTVVDKDSSSLSFELMPSTLKLTNLGSLRIQERINLERSLKLGQRICGHLVYGHIDCIGIIRKRRFLQNNLCFEIAIPLTYIKNIILRGSLAVDGISLTVQKKLGNLFSVYIIPHTFKNTTLGFKGPSDKVNIEFDKSIGLSI